MNLETLLARRKISLEEWLDSQENIAKALNSNFFISKELEEKIVYYFNNKKTPTELSLTIERAAEPAVQEKIQMPVLDEEQMVVLPKQEAQLIPEKQNRAAKQKQNDK
jgi:hypothetical protein